MWTQDAEGHHLVASFANAPFPHSSRSYTDDRVMVSLPPNYRVGSEVDVLVHFHGHNGEILASDAWHLFRQQLRLAAKNVVLVQPQGPLLASDSGIGKLEEQDGLKNLLGEVLSLLVAEGAASQGAQIRKLALSGHSGGYFAIARCIEKGGMAAELAEVYLHDALYGQVAVFNAWARQAGHRLVSTYQGGGSPGQNSLALGQDLAAAGVAVGWTLQAADLDQSSTTIARLDHAHSRIIRGRFTFERLLRRSALADNGVPVPRLRSAVRQNGQTRLAWTPLKSQHCAGYRLYHSLDGTSYSPVLDLGSSASSALHAGSGGYYALSAVDDQGNESARSDVYGAWETASTRGRVLVVDGFHRRSGSSQPAAQHDLAVLHGLAIVAAGRAFDVASAVAVVAGEVSLSDYASVDWFAGDQSTYDQSLSHEEQDALSGYLEAGGTLLLSGSELAYDLNQGGSTDKGFLNSTLRAYYRGDQANSQDVSGEGVLSGLQLGFGGPGAPYPEDFPDYLEATGGATPALRYGDGRVAGVFYEGSFGGSLELSGLFLLGFPAETADSQAERDALLAACLHELDAVNLRAGR